MVTSVIKDSGLIFTRKNEYDLCQWEIPPGKNQALTKRVSDSRVIEFGVRNQNICYVMLILYIFK